MAAKLEWRVREIEDCSLWEIVAYIDGLNEANGGSKVEPPSNDEFDAMLQAHNLG